MVYSQASVARIGEQGNKRMIPFQKLRKSRSRRIKLEIKGKEHSSESVNDASGD